MPPPKVLENAKRARTFISSKVRLFLENYILLMVMLCFSHIMFRTISFSSVSFSCVIETLLNSV